MRSGAGPILLGVSIMFSWALPGTCRTAEENESRHQHNGTELRIFIKCEVESETKARKPQASPRVARLLQSRLRRRSARCRCRRRFLDNFNLVARSNCFNTPEHK